MADKWDEEAQTIWLKAKASCDSPWQISIDVTIAAVAAALRELGESMVRLTAQLHARELAGYRSREAEIERLHTMSTIEMMLENKNVEAHVKEWEDRCLKAEAEIERLKQLDEIGAKAHNANLLEMAEMRAVIRQAQAAIVTHHDDRTATLYKTINDLCSQLAQIKDDTLEDAAKLADTLLDWCEPIGMYQNQYMAQTLGDELAAAIRKKKGKT